MELIKSPKKFLSKELLTDEKVNMKFIAFNVYCCDK